MNITIGIVKVGASAPQHEQVVKNNVYQWLDFARACGKPSIGSKDGPYLLRGKCEGHRCNENMELSGMLVIDGDSLFDPATGEMDGLSAPPPALAHEALKKLGLTHALHTSYSHMQGGKGNRWRAYVPTDREYTKAEIGRLTTALHEAVQGAGCPVMQTKESSVFSQPWYQPRIAMDDAPFEHYHFDGIPFAVDGALAATAKERRDERPVQVQASTIPADLEKARAALEYLSPTLGYQDWINVGMALESTGVSGAFEVWDEWSSKGGDKYHGTDDLRRHWKGFSRDKGITLGTLFHLAKEEGWNAAKWEREQAIMRLAGLSTLDYEAVRETEAKKLKVRVGVLDKEVEKHRAPDEQAPLFTEIDPWPDVVDGGALLDEIASTIRRYIVVPDHTPETVALWVLNTYVHDASYHSPMLLITSPEKRCGKSSLLSLLYALSNNALLASNISAAAVYRAIDQWKPTLLIDEADTFLKENDDMAGVINAGHTKTTAFVMRCDGDANEVKQFSTWCPKVIAGIGSQRDTLEDRSVVISLRRKMKGEHVARLRLDRTDFSDIKRKCVRWSADNYVAVHESDPKTPDDLHDRAADNWSPLFAIADLCGWHDKADAASLALSGSDGSESINIDLLADIKGILEEITRGKHKPNLEPGERSQYGKDRISSKVLCAWLAELEDRPWRTWSRGRPMSQNALANRLKLFNIHSATIRLNHRDTLRGYYFKGFEDAFTRYLPDS